MEEVALVSSDAAAATRIEVTWDVLGGGEQLRRVEKVALLRGVATTRHEVRAWSLTLDREGLRGERRAGLGLRLAARRGLRGAASSIGAFLRIVTLAPAKRLIRAPLAGAEGAVARAAQQA